MIKLLVFLFCLTFSFFINASNQTVTPLANLETITPVISCSQLAEINFSEKLSENIVINSATERSTEKGDFCQISATISPEIGINVALPLTHWTQRFLQVGCGGLCGNINLSIANASSCTPALNGEFIVAATDMGHKGSMMDASWAEDPQKRIDFAYRANHVTAKLAKALAESYYQQQPKYSYFMGCSDGGREALMEAQRYPDDFDGIVAGAPAAFFQFQNSFYHGWNIVANLRADGTSILLNDRLAILHNAVLKNCPTFSGVDDGILQDPYACKFSAQWVKVCQDDQQDKSACLTQEEIDVAERLYQGATDANGDHFVLGGLPIGSELRWPVPSSPNGSSMSAMMVLPALQYVLLPESDISIKSMADFPLNRYDFDRVAQLTPLYNAANTNLSPFMERGGKLIMWHGLSDDSVSPAFSLAYYQGVLQTLGKSKSEEFLRLFLLPGVGHCGGGEGYDQVDLLTPIMAWTENNQTPQTIITAKTIKSQQKKQPPLIDKKGEPLLMSAEAQFHGLQAASVPLAKPEAAIIATRPVYAYPYIAEYKGHGDKNQAINYQPIMSQLANQLTFGKPAILYVAPNNQKNYKVIEGKLTEQK